MSGPRAASPDADPARSAPRVDGVDLARGLALIGMFIAHAAPAVTSPVGSALLAVADERPRLLFALVAGVGLGLLTGATRPVADRGARRELRVQIAIRAVILVLLGFAITTYLRPLVFVILEEYGVAFLVILPLVFLPAAAVLAIGVAGLLVMPGLAVWAAATPEVQAAPAGPAEVLAEWFVSGAYPVVVWVPVMLIGLGLARLGIARPSVVGWSGLAGALAAAALLPAASALPSPVLVAPIGANALPVAARVGLETAGNVGVGLAVTAGCVALLSLTPDAVRRISGAIASPVVAMGAMPLSVYTLHLVVLALAIRTENGIRTDDSWPLTIGLIVGAMLFAWTWRRVIGRGPLEMVLRLASGRERSDAAAGR